MRAALVLLALIVASAYTPVAQAQCVNCVCMCLDDAGFASPDAGFAPDAVDPDAGFDPPDAGFAPDADPPDLGPPDSGVAPDAGPPVMVVSSQTMQAPTAVGATQTRLRSWTQATPTNLPPNSPLVVNVHGMGWQGSSLRLSDPRTEAAAMVPALWVYPDGVLSCGGSPCWDLSAGGIDVAFLDALIARLVAQYNLDPQRVYLVGRSYGGAMAITYVSARPGAIRALATTIQYVSPLSPTAPMDVSIWAASGDPTVGSIPATYRTTWMGVNQCVNVPPPARPTVYGAVADQVLICSLARLEYHLEFLNAHAPASPESGTGIATFFGLR